MTTMADLLWAEYKDKSVRAVADALSMKELCAAVEQEEHDNIAEQLIAMHRGLA